MRGKGIEEKMMGEAWDEKLIKMRWEKALIKEMIRGEASYETIKQLEVREEDTEEEMIREGWNE